MPLPVDYQTCTVTGSWVDIATSDPGSGYVVFTPRATRITTGSEVIVLPTARRVWLEGGAINIELPATDDPDVTPVDWTYQVVETIGGVEYPAYDIEAPAGGTVDLSSAVGVGSAGTIIAVQGAHAASHTDGGSDEITVAQSQVTGLATTLFTIGNTITDHTDEPDLALVHGGIASANHASRHGDGGADELALDASQITTGTVATARLGSGSASASTFLRGDQTWAGGSGIAATIVDAAGDLIIGTAADTVARLAVGTSGQALTSNGTTAAWAMPWTATHAPTITATAIGSNESCVYSTPGQRAANTNHGLTAAGAEVWVPLPFDAGTYDRISVYVTTAAVSTWRIGLDSMATNGKFAPGANVLDAGTLNMNTGTGHQALNISLTIPTTGIYWARVLCTAYTGSPGTVNLDGNSGNSWASMVCRGWPSSPASYLRGFVGHVGSTGGTGAFAATPAPAALGTVLPVVYFRRAS